MLYFGGTFVPHYLVPIPAFAGMTDFSEICTLNSEVSA